MLHYTYRRIFSSRKYKTAFAQVPPLGMLTPDDNNLANFLQSIMNKSWLTMNSRPSVFQQLPPTYWLIPYSVADINVYLLTISI